MSFNIPPILVYIASWLGMMGGVWALFDRAEKIIDPKVKEKISSWLLTTEVPVDERWPTTFENLSDKVFGRKLISAWSFFVSLNLSILTVILLTALSYYLKPAAYASQWEIYGFIGVGIMIWVLPVFFNVFQDYLSAIQTRFLLRKMKHNFNQLKQWSFLFVDFCFTTALIWLTLYFIDNFILSESHEPTDMLIRALSFESVYKHGKDITLAPFVYSTYLTSVWIWLYALSGFVVKLMRKFSWSLKVVQRFMNIEEKPLQSLGFISMLIVTMVYLIIPFVVQS